MRITPARLLLRQCIRLSAAWALRLEIFWSLPAASETSSVYCQKECPNPSCTAWSWMASADALQSCCTLMHGLILLAMKRQASRMISLTLPLATCRSGSIRSTTRNTISWAFLFIITSWLNPWIKCVPAASWRLSPPVIQWIPRIQT